MRLYWHVESLPERRDAARDAIERGRAIAPDLPELNIAEGYYHYWGFRDYEKALQSLAPALEAYPNNAELVSLKAFIQRRMGDFDASLEGLRRALELEPRSVEVISSLSETYVGLREYEKSDEYLSLLEAINPNHQIYHFTAGYNRYAIDGDPAAALEHWKTDPAEYVLEIWLAQSALGDINAFDNFDAFADAQGIGEVIYLPDMMRGVTRHLAGDQEAAKPYLDRARQYYLDILEKQADDFRALKPLCLIEGARHDAAATTDVCQRALDRLPADQYDRNFHRAELAGGFAMAGLDEQALDLLEATLSERFGPTPTEIGLNTMLQSLHDEPRWQGITVR